MPDEHTCKVMSFPNMLIGTYPNSRPPRKQPHPTDKLQLLLVKLRSKPPFVQCLRLHYQRSSCET